jgi:hypothetical protein
MSGDGARGVGLLVVGSLYRFVRVGGPKCYG